jgi:Spy/CpxP family protein refolding chaperone
VTHHPIAGSASIINNRSLTMRKHYRILTLTATALAMTIGAAHAATPDAPPPGGPGGHHMEMRMQQQLDQLHGQLKLNADQEKLWQTALDTMKQNRAAMRESHRQMHQQFESMQQQPILDLNAMHAAHQKIEQQNAQLRDQTATAWLNFYNALNDQQKTTVSTALKKHFARMHEREQKMHEHWGKRGGADAAAGASAAKP